MLGILRNKNIKSVETDVNNNGIKIEMKLRKSIVGMDKFSVFSAIYDFDDFIKSVLTSDDEDYLNKSSYEYQLLMKYDKLDNKLLFRILYNYILDYKNSTAIYGYHNKKISNNVLINYKSDENKVGVEINKNIFNKYVFENWN